MENKRFSALNSVRLLCDELSWGKSTPNVFRCCSQGALRYWCVIRFCGWLVLACSCLVAGMKFLLPKRKKWKTKGFLLSTTLAFFVMMNFPGGGLPQTCLDAALREQLGTGVWFAFVVVLFWLVLVSLQEWNSYQLLPKRKKWKTKELGKLWRIRKWATADLPVYLQPQPLFDFEYIFYIFFPPKHHEKFFFDK